MSDTRQESSLRANWLQRQQADFAAGQGRRVEDYLADEPRLAENPELLVDLVYAEFRLREAAGETPKAAEYMQRFPQLREQLAPLFEVHSAMQNLESRGPSETLPHTLDEATTELGMTASRRRFRIVRPHAKGGLGEVFVAVDEELQREVALKNIQDRYADDPDRRQRFLREAEITGRLEHPSIVPVYGLGHHADGRPFYAMRFIRGTSLKQAISEHHRERDEGTKPVDQLAFRKLLQRFVSVCEAIEYAHSRGIVHRDIKPSNIMLGKYGETLVVDWGLAKTIGRPESHVSADESMIQPASGGSSDPTRMGTAIGTPAYMSPEQASGQIESIGPLSDVYSLGATLYCLLTGRSPFEEPNIDLVIDNVRKGEFPHPREVKPQTPHTLESICLMAMSFRPEDRYSSPRALADDIEHWLADEPVTAHRESTAQRLTRWTRRHRAWTRAGAAAITLVAVVSVIAVILIQKYRTNEVRAYANEVRALRIATATDRFNRGLTSADWSAAHLSAMDALLDELASLQYEHLAEYQTRLPQELAQSIRKSLQVTTLTPEDIAHVEAQLALLKARDPNSEAALRQDLAARMRRWQPVFALAAPFGGLSQVLDPAQVRVEGDSLLLHATLGQPAPSSVVATQIPCSGNVQLHATFQPSWENSSELGLVFQYGTANRYEFILRAAPSATLKAGDKSPSLTFAEARRQQGIYLLEIRRSGVTLQRREVRAGEIAPGALKLVAERQRERLVWRVHTFAPLEFFDPFPLTSQDGQFALHWPMGTGLKELRGTRQMLPLQPNPLEAADQLYDEGRFADALAQYERLDVPVGETGVRQESYIKQALCLEALNRAEEAAKLYRQVMTEPGERWPPLAGMHLWLFLEKQRKLSEAQAVFDHLLVNYRVEHLAAVVPSNVRDELLKAHVRQFQGLLTIYRPNAAQQMLQKAERLAAIDRFLSRDGQGDLEIQFVLLRAYMNANDIQRALPLAETMYRRTFSYYFGLRDYLRLLTWNGNAKLALDEVDAFLSDPRIITAPNAGQHALAYVSRARIHALLKDWKSADRDLDRALALDNSTDLIAAVDLIRGCLLDQRGHHDAARSVFQDGFRKTKGTMLKGDAKNLGTLRCLIMGSLCDEIAANQALDRFSLMLGDEANPVAVQAVKNAFDPQIIDAILVKMWRSSRGRQIVMDTEVLEAVPPGERLRLLAQLAALETVRQGAFGGIMSAQQEEFVWDATRRLYQAAWLDGKIGIPQLLHVMVSGKGTTGVLGWDGVAPSLPGEFRPHATYIFGHRFLQLKNPAEAQRLWMVAKQESPPDSILSRLIDADLKLLAAKQGRVTIRSNRGQPVRVRLSRENSDPIEIEVDEIAEVDLSAGTYKITMDGPHPDLELSSSKLAVVPARSQDLRVNWKWQPATDEPVLIGLVPHPAALAQIGPWQMETVAPRDRITGLAWSPRDSRIACATINGQVRLYEPDGWRLLAMLPAHAGGEVKVAWNSLGQLVTGGEDKLIRIWREDGTLEHVLFGHTAAVRSVSWSPDGKRLASAGDDGEIRLWAAFDSPPQVLKGHAGTVYALAWRPDGSQLVSGGADRSIRLWNLDGSKGRVLAGHNSNVTCLDWSPDGQWIASGDSEGSVRLWIAESGKASAVLKQSGSRQAIAWSPDSSKFAVVGEESGLSFCDTAGMETQPLAGHGYGVTTVIWSHDGRSLATGHNLGMLRLWDAAGKARSSLAGVGIVQSAAWNRDGGQVAAGMSDYSIRLFAADGAPGAILKGHTSGVSDVIWNPRDGVLTSSSYDGTIRFWNSDGSSGPVLKGPSAVSSLAWDAEGRQLGSASQDGIVRFWNGTSLVGSTEDAKGRQVQSLAFGSGTASWTAGANRPEVSEILTWTADRVPGPRWKLETGSVKTLAWNPAGTRLASGGWEKHVRVWRPDGAIERLLVGHTSGITRVAWSADGSQLASTSLDSTVRTWNPNNGNAGLVLAGHTGDAMTVGWSPDDRRIISGGRDGTLRTWDAATGESIWVAASLADDQCVVVSSGGQVLHATAAAERHFVYLVEAPDRRIEILTPAEFRGRINGVD